jgi:hypothetical protein
MNEKGVFNKLMLVQATSIIEVALDQIFYRAAEFKREGVPNISEEDRKKIADTSFERFNTILQALPKYKILDGLDAGMQADLERLRDFRNRIHIQLDSQIEDVPRREDQAFSDKVVAWSLEGCLKILNHLNKRYPRPVGFEQYAREVSIPLG